MNDIVFCDPPPANQERRGYWAKIVDTHLIGRPGEWARCLERVPVSTTDYAQRALRRLGCEVTIRRYPENRASLWARWLVVDNAGVPLPEGAPA